MDALTGDAAVARQLYGVSYTTLYRVAPSTFEPTNLGTLCANLGPIPNIADIVIDPGGSLYVTTQQARMFRADLPSLDCVELSLGVGADLLGLSFVPPGVLDPMRYVLVAAASNSSLYRVDPMTGLANAIGPLGATPSCGLAWTGTELLITVDGTGGDNLARINLSSGAATVIGPTGAEVWGLAWFNGELLGFTNAGEIRAIAPATGASVVRRAGLSMWSGATTSL
jgi:hypothetical protein